MLLRVFGRPRIDRGVPFLLANMAIASGLSMGSNGCMQLLGRLLVLGCFLCSSFLLNLMMVWCLYSMGM